jgi:hypothetical protein
MKINFNKVVNGIIGLTLYDIYSSTIIFRLRTSPRARVLVPSRRGGELRVRPCVRLTRISRQQPWMQRQRDGLFAGRQRRSDTIFRSSSVELFLWAFTFYFECSPRLG